MQMGDGAEHGHGHTERPEGDRRRVEDQRIGQRLDRGPADHDEHGGDDGDGRSEAGDPLQQGAKAEAQHDQDNTPVIRQMFQNPVSEGVEAAGDDGDIVDRERRDDDPHDRPEGKDTAGEGGIQRDAGRDMPAEDGDDDAGDQPRQGRLPARPPHDAEQHEHDDDGKRADDEGQAEAAADGGEILVKHLWSFSLARSCASRRGAVRLRGASPPRLVAESI